MRASSAIALISLAAVATFACSSDPKPVAWNCSDVAVPNGTNVECTASSSSGLDGPYTCNVYGDYNPECPPPGADSDGGTGDFNPDGGSDGSTGDGTPDGGGG